MDKIEKIHIAKVPYSIETKAETELKKYLADIRSNLDVDTADEVIHDIESRIPELLLARKVKANDVIATDDVDAIKQQLGEPEQFSDEDIPAKVSVSPKKLFRDMDGAMLGGVASGIGQYINVDANLVRLAFFVLVFFYGFGILLYLFLWLLLPEAKTGADKLMMMGKPVTAATLQKYRMSVQQSLGKGPKLVQSLLYKILRWFSLGFTSLASLILLVLFSLVTGLFYIDPFRSILSGYDVDYLILALVWVACLSFIGLLISLTIRIWGNRSVRLNISAIGLAVIFIVAVTVTSISSLVAYNHFSNKYSSNKITRGLPMTIASSAVMPTSLDVNADQDLALTYVVTNQQPHATYKAYPGLNQPNITIIDKNSMISVSATQLTSAAPSCLGRLCQKIYLPVRVTLYGPALSTYTDVNGASLTINDADLGKSVTFNAQNSSNITINNDSAVAMSITANNYAMVSAYNTTAQTVSVSVDQSSIVNSPIATSLSATIPNECFNSDFPSTVLQLPGYPDHTQINGQPQTMSSLNQNDCITNNE